MYDSRRSLRSAAGQDAVWIGVVVASTVGLSLLFACATPFAALGALAGTQTRRIQGLALVASTWLANQLIGYFVLAYPRTWDSLAWGLAIGVAASLSEMSARQAKRLAAGSLFSTPAAFLVAFLAYESALFAATGVLPSSAAAFSLPIVARVLAIDVVAFVALLLLWRAAVLVGLQDADAAPGFAVGRG